MNSRPATSRERVNRLVGDVAAQLADGGLRVGEVPEDDADDHGTSDRMLRTVISGAFAAALTPLRDGGAALDEAAFAPYVDFLVAGGVDGVLALGTTGEGMLLSVAERRRAAELFIAAAGGPRARSPCTAVRRRRPTRRRSPRTPPRRAPPRWR